MILGEEAIGVIGYLSLWLASSHTHMLACWGHRHRTGHLSGRGMGHIVHKPLHSESPECAALSLLRSLLLTEGDTANTVA